MLQNKESIKAALERANESEKEIGKILSCDVVCYIGQLHDANLSFFRDSIEAIAEEDKNENLAICLTTGGGGAEVVEGMVRLIRHHYRKVYFIVPAFAMSAGTIFCMSGDEIYMDYSSCLGPIDPQIFVEGEGYVPAQGYLDKVEEFVKKAESGGKINAAEYLLLKDLDLAALRRYEQARTLSIELLTDWLVEYKFADWKTHETNEAKRGKEVTVDEKRTRAEEIGKKLSDNNTWLSHGRRIHMDMMRKQVRLKIKDFGENPKLSRNIRLYYNILFDYYRHRVVPNVTADSPHALIYSNKWGGTLS